tara:strand:+ start:5459 stop:6301 length:843 start_codon:yes stop_codon:yes gene_type:complete
MINVIGLGNIGCAIAEKFRVHSQYEVYKIGAGLSDKDNKNSFSIKKRTSPEDYEEKFPAKVMNVLKKIDGDILFIVSGGTDISSASLRILQAVAPRRIEVLYIKPDLIDDHSKSLDRMVSGVFQEYARSGLFEKLYLVSNSEIEKVIGNIPIGRYQDTINEFISSTLHMLNVYRNTEAIISSYPKESGICRICTIGIGEMEKMADQMCFSLDKVNEKSYYFAINKKQVDNDTDLLFRVKKRVAQKDDDIKVGFGVYSTEYDKNYIYIISQTKIIQGVNYG